MSFDAPWASSADELDRESMAELRSSHREAELSVRRWGYATYCVLGFLYSLPAFCVFFPMLIDFRFGYGGPSSGWLLVGLVFGALSIASFVVAVGLSRLVAHRGLGTIVAGLALIAFPVGTAAGVFGLMALWSPKKRTVTSQRYRDGLLCLGETAPTTPWLSIALWILVSIAGCIVFFFSALRM